jgi:hypothetical protein
VGVAVDVAVGVEVSCGVRVRVLVFVRVGVALRLVEVRVTLGVLVAVVVMVVWGVTVIVGDGLFRGVRVNVGVSLVPPVGVFVGVSLTRGVSVGVGVIVEVLVTVKDGGDVGDGHDRLAIRSPHPPSIPTSPLPTTSYTSNVHTPPDCVFCSSAPSGRKDPMRGGQAEPMRFIELLTIVKPVFSNVQSGSAWHTFVNRVLRRPVGPSR